MISRNYIVKTDISIPDDNNKPDTYNPYKGNFDARNIENYTIYLDEVKQDGIQVGDATAYKFVFNKNNVTAYVTKRDGKVVVSQGTYKVQDNPNDISKTIDIDIIENGIDTHHTIYLNDNWEIKIKQYFTVFKVTKIIPNS